MSLEHAIRRQIYILFPAILNNNKNKSKKLQRLNVSYSQMRNKSYMFRSTVVLHSQFRINIRYTELKVNCLYGVPEAIYLLVVFHLV